MYAAYCVFRMELEVLVGVCRMTGYRWWWGLSDRMTNSLRICDTRKKRTYQTAHKKWLWIIWCLLTIHSKAGHLSFKCTERRSENSHHNQYIFLQITVGVLPGFRAPWWRRPTKRAKWTCYFGHLAVLSASDFLARDIRFYARFHKSKPLLKRFSNLGSGPSVRGPVYIGPPDDTI